MQRKKRVFTALPGGRIKRVQGRWNGERSDKFGRTPNDRRSERRAERQAFRTNVSRGSLQFA